MTGTTQSSNRFGLHYFPDTLHYRQTDLRAWLPELRSLGITSLVLDAPNDRAIPEDFISGLCAAGIRPIPHFKFSPDRTLNPEELASIFDAYRRWGVKEIVLYDRPNSRQTWQATAWAQTDLIERFLTGFTPLAETIVAMNMMPVFPPLEPGGDYWDTAFLRAALQSLQKMEKTSILEKLILGAYAPAGDRPLDWGSGGPERWPGARPYYTPAEEQDQCGCCISDWYRAISRAVLGKALPMMLFGAGSPGWMAIPADEYQITSQDVEKNLTLIAQAQGTMESAPVEALSEDILACHFWLLSAAADSPQAALAWYRSDGQTSALVGVLKQRQAQSGQPQVVQTELHPVENLPLPTKEYNDAETQPDQDVNTLQSPSASTLAEQGVVERHPISHYLLLPTNKDGLFDVQIEGIYSFIKKHNLTVGFSLDEAALAAQVTILEIENSLPARDLEYLRSLGSKVVCIRGSGIELAQFLSAF
jgi:hypothetical protein